LPDASSTPVGLGYALEGGMRPSPNGTQRGSIGSEGVSDETAEIATPIIASQEGERKREDAGGERGLAVGEELERPRLLAAFEDSPRSESGRLEDADHSRSSGETEMPSGFPLHFGFSGTRRVLMTSDVRYSQVMTGQAEYIITQSSPRSMMLLPEGDYNDSTTSLPMLARPAVSPSIFGIPDNAVDHSTPPRARLAV
jgi:hypothetical protein